MSEVTLAAQVVSWLQNQHWTVYQEVQPYGFGGRADIVAVRDGIVWVIECKNSLSLSVLAQADRWEAHYRSVAVPQPKNGRGLDERAFTHKVCNWLGLGLIEVDVKRQYVREWKAASLKREYHAKAKELLSKLHPQQQTGPMAGSRDGGYWTPYRQSMWSIRQVLQRYPKGLTIKEILAALGKMHYAHETSARSNLPHCLESYEKDWCQVDKTVSPWRYSIKPGV